MCQCWQFFHLFSWNIRTCFITFQRHSRRFRWWENIFFARASKTIIIFRFSSCNLPSFVLCLSSRFKYTILKLNNMWWKIKHKSWQIHTPSLPDIMERPTLSFGVVKSIQNGFVLTNKWGESHSIISGSPLPGSFVVMGKWGEFLSALSGSLS